MGPGLSLRIDRVYVVLNNIIMNIMTLTAFYKPQKTKKWQIVFEMLLAQ